MERDQLLKNEGYWISKIQIDLYDQLEKYMVENNLNRTQLAKKLNVSKGYISQILNGDFDHRMSKFIELALAIDKIPEITFKDLNQVIQDEKDGFRSITLQYLKKDYPNMDSNSRNNSKSIEIILKPDYQSIIEEKSKCSSA